MRHLSRIIELEPTAENYIRREVWNIDPHFAGPQEITELYPINEYFDRFDDLTKAISITSDSQERMTAYTI